MTRQIERQTPHGTIKGAFRKREDIMISEAEALRRIERFEQKPIILLLHESVFKCKSREACEDNCKICEIESIEECEDRIPCKGDKIKFVCKYCEGNGSFKNGLMDMTCTDCKGKGSITIKVFKAEVHGDKVLLEGEDE